MPTTTQADQQTMFHTMERHVDGRRVESSIPIESTRDGDDHAVLEVGTSHSPGRGYAVTISRPYIHGPFKRLCLSFGADGDMQTLNMDEHLPASTRFNKNALTKLHTTAIEIVQARIEHWLEWAARGKTSI